MSDVEPVAWVIRGRVSGNVKRITDDSELAGEESEFYDVSPLYERPPHLTATREALIELLTASLYDRGNQVTDWPEDEAEAYRELRWWEGREAARKLMFAKAVDALLAPGGPIQLVSDVQAAQREADEKAVDDIVTTPWNENHREYWKGFSDGTAVAAAAIRSTDPTGDKK